MISAWLAAFALTQLVEVPIYRYGARASWSTALLASTFTHPVVWFVFPLLTSLSYWQMVACAELFAVLFEAAWLRIRGIDGVRRALGWSLLANAASVVIGLGLRSAFGAP